MEGGKTGIKEGRMGDRSVRPTSEDIMPHIIFRQV